MRNEPYVLLVGVDFSELANRALQEAFTLASQRENAVVHVLSALPVASEDPSYAISVFATSGEDATILETAMKRLGEYLQVQLEQFGREHQESKRTFRLVSHAIVDTAAHAIVQLASDLGVDLIVIGTHNPKGVERFLLGSVAEATVRDAPCPVLVIPPPKKPEATVHFAAPCSECVRARASSGGKELWCAQHSERHGRRHTYHQSDRSSVESNFPLVFQ